MQRPTGLTLYCIAFVLLPLVVMPLVGGRTSSFEPDRVAQYANDGDDGSDLFLQGDYRVWWTVHGNCQVSLASADGEDLELIYDSTHSPDSMREIGGLRQAAYSIDIVGVCHWELVFDPA
jgi:hypothetical protein